jgi:tRNA(His) guanylyltransferase
MKFDDLDSKMRVFETASDQCALPEMFLVARIDGRSFTRLTNELHDFEKPFDIKMRDYMVETTAHLMNCGFNVTYGYTQSDEISLLLARNITAFDRKLRKYNSILAGEASAKFSLLLGDVAAFDCRISQLPTVDLVCDYFRWRNEDAHRNALNGYCYWKLREMGKGVKEATALLSRRSVADKNELLFSHGINFNEVPNWQKRGAGLLWETYEKQSVNPLDGTNIIASRRRIKKEYDLPMKDEYSLFIKELVLAS